MFKVTYKLGWYRGKVRFQIYSKYTGQVIISTRVNCPASEDFDPESVFIKNDKPATKLLRKIDITVSEYLMNNEFNTKAEFSKGVTGIVKKYISPRLSSSEHTVLFMLADNQLNKRREMALAVINLKKRTNRLKGVMQDVNALKSLKMFTPNLTEQMVCNEDFPEKYFNWLGTQYTEKTAFQYYVRVSSIIKSLFRKKLIEVDTFDAFSMFVPELPTYSKGALTNAELSLLDKLDPEYDFMNSEMILLNTIRISYDMFALACGIGWRLSDIQNIRLSDIYTVNDNELIIQRITQKKEVKATVNLSTLYNGKLLKHLYPYTSHKEEKWDLEESVNGSPDKENELLFAITSNKISNDMNYPIIARINEYLRIIFSSCDIDQKYTFHSARHTAVTQLCKVLDSPFKLASIVGISLSMASKIYNHYEVHAKDDRASIKKIIQIININNI